MRTNVPELRAARATDLPAVIELLETSGLPTGDLTEARRRGAATAYLLTTTAAEYFRRRGYTDVPREAVPAIVAGHAQFRSLCPASAKCLEKRLA